MAWNANSKSYKFLQELLADEFYINDMVVDKNTMGLDVCEDLLILIKHGKFSKKHFKENYKEIICKYWHEPMFLGTYHLEHLEKTIDGLFICERTAEAIKTILG